MNAWLVLSHDGCTFVERHEELFAEPTGTLPGAAEIVGRRDIRSLGGAEHDALHRPMAHAWRPDGIAAYTADAVRSIVTERLDALAGCERIELYSEFARLLPIAVVARVLGLPDADATTLDQAKGWLEAVLSWRHTYGEDPDARAAAVEATKALEPALLDTVRARRDRPEADAISLLWETGRGIFPDWGERDVLDNARFLFEGGSETTAFLICNAVHLLFQQSPGQRATSLSDADAWRLFLEEVLRHTTVVHLRARFATTDVLLDGVEIGAGDRVIAINAAANRDPLRWERPSAFDPGRAQLFSHLAFNVGPRHCVGAHLARLEATVAIRSLFVAFPDLERDPAGPPAASVGFVSRAWRPLHLIRDRPRSAEGTSSLRLSGQQRDRDLTRDGVNAIRSQVWGHGQDDVVGANRNESVGKVECLAPGLRARARRDLRRELEARWVASELAHPVEQHRPSLGEVGDAVRSTVGQHERDDPTLDVPSRQIDPATLLATEPDGGAAGSQCARLVRGVREGHIGVWSSDPGHLACVVGEHRSEDGQSRLQAVETLDNRRERDAERGVLRLVPARPEARDEPPAGHVVKDRQLFGQYRRVPERRRQDANTEPLARNAMGEGSERRDRLEACAADRVLCIVKVVVQPDGLEHGMLTDP